MAKRHLSLFEGYMCFIVQWVNNVLSRQAGVKIQIILVIWTGTLGIRFGLKRLDNEDYSDK
jgi:hypothetical protein